MPWRQALTLDWRLLWRSLQQSSGELWSVIALTLLSAATAGESSFELGRQLATHPLDAGQATLLVGLRIWAAFLAAFVFVLATGELSFMRRLLADFAVRPISQRQAFVALQAVSIGGRQCLALLSVGLPVLILATSWLDGVQLAAAVASMFVMMRLPVAVLTIGARVASASLTVALVTTLGLLIIVAVLWQAAPDLLIRWLPPFLVVRILMTDAAGSAWAGLGVWTLALAVIEFSTMGIQSAPVPSPAAAAQQHQPLPAAMRRVAAVTGCSPVLLHGELLRLSRWRRYQLSWLMCALMMVLMGSRLPDHPGFLRAVIFLVIPVHVGSSMLGNLFATDRAGFLAMVMSPISLGTVIRAKVIAGLLFTLLASLMGVAFLVARGADWQLVATAGTLAAGLFAWTASVGVLTSVLFPSASDPQAVGGSLVNTSAAVAIVAGASLYLGPALRLAFLYDAGRIAPWAGALAGAGLVVVAMMALLAVSRISTRLATLRVESMIAALTTNPGTHA